MRRSLARYSAPVSSVHAPSWADFITTMVGFRVFGTHNPRLNVFRATAGTFTEVARPSLNSGNINRCSMEDARRSASHLKIPSLAPRPNSPRRAEWLPHPRTQPFAAVLALLGNDHAGLPETSAQARRAWTPLCFGRLGPKFPKTGLFRTAPAPRRILSFPKRSHVSSKMPESLATR